MRPDLISDIIPVAPRAILCFALASLSYPADAQVSVIEENSGYECGLVDQQKIRLGLDEGVNGRCSNNGLAITCTLNDQTGWRCSGPGNTVTGFSLEQVIGEACGCKSNPFLNDELGNE